ncbi:MAG: hypothetical protein ACYC1C_01530 [Chloroflexota bacterium]
MKWLDTRVAWGILLIFLGVVFLLQTLGVIPTDMPVLWVIIFGLAGLGFIYVFLANIAKSWWAIIPGFTLLGVATLVGLGTYAPRTAELWGGTIFLGALGLSFWIVYLVQLKNWWAIIPGGVLLTLGAVAALGQMFDGVETGGAFFLGLGLTFLLLYVLPTNGRNTRWALIPAGVLIVMGGFMTVVAADMLGYILAVVMIVAGAYLLFRSRGGPRSQLE